MLGRDPEVPAQRTDIRRRLGYQPQEVGFPRGFTAFAFVDYIALLKEWTEPAARHAEVGRVLGLVGLSDLATKRIRAMSGGQQRRVALAQALLGSPPVLILDEPTTGVDPEQRVTLRTVLAEIARRSIVVLSTHQTEDVAALCERVMPMRTAALCAVAIVPFLCGVLSLIAFRLYQPVTGDWVYGALSPPARIAMLVEQMILPTLGGPLLGVALGRWVWFPGAAFVLFLILYGWVSLVTSVSFTHPDPTPNVALRLSAPFAFFTASENAAEVTTWRGSPWLFIGWQLALCAIAVLAALLRGAESRVRFKIVRALPIVLVVAVILLVLASGGGLAHAVRA